MAKKKIEFEIKIKPEDDKDWKPWARPVVRHKDKSKYNRRKKYGGSDNEAK